LTFSGQGLAPTVWSAEPGLSWGQPGPDGRGDARTHRRLPRELEERRCLPPPVQLRMSAGAGQDPPHRSRRTRRGVTRRTAALARARLTRALELSALRSVERVGRECRSFCLRFDDPREVSAALPVPELLPGRGQTEAVRDSHHLAVSGSDDLGCVLLVESDDDRVFADGLEFNVGRGVPVDIVTVIEALSAAYGHEPNYVISGEFRPGDVRHLALDTRRLRALGWGPLTPLEEGLEGMAEWILGLGHVTDYFSETLAALRSGRVVRQSDRR
jgi:hypothetical protein